jgi:hypothetical protein
MSASDDVFSGTVEVCCHTVAFRYWDFEHELTEELEGVLTEHAEERAKQCISDGFFSGQLNCFYATDDNDEEIRGWWEIET